MDPPDPLRTIREQLAAASRAVCLGGLETMLPQQRANAVLDMIQIFRAALDQMDALAKQTAADLATKEQVIADLRLELDLLRPEATP